MSDEQMQPADGEYDEQRLDTTSSDEGSQGRPMGGTKIGVGTGMTLGASRGNSGPGTGSDELEQQYASRDFSGATPGASEYDGGGMTNERGQLANAIGNPDRGLGDEPLTPATNNPDGSPRDTQGLGDDDTDAYE